MLKRLLPFLSWFEAYDISSFRSDFIAGLTVALVLIPQSMAYAQLAGLPAYYGLYAAFLPPMVAALFGSSRQLATGPVAVVSLMTAATLEPLATAGSETYIAYAILLALVVGLFQLSLGLLRLGVVVNFLSHPVVNGFTNAAALIIASSQLSKIFGVYVDKAEHHYETIWRVLVATFHYTHWPTFGFDLLSFAIMYGVKRLNPKIPNVLVAVVVTVIISWATGFEHNEVVKLGSIASESAQAALLDLNTAIHEIEVLETERAETSAAEIQAEKEYGSHSIQVTRISQEVEITNLRIEELKKEAFLLRETLRRYLFDAVPQEDGSLRFFPHGESPPGSSTDGRKWRISCGYNPIDEHAITMTGGGAVVGTIPPGLPSISVPQIDFSLMTRFLGAAVIISLLGFMEAISIAKAMATKTGQRLDPNQELIGQGLANIIGSFGSSYPVSGSFSRSAVNIQADAVSGISSVVTSLVVVVVLLFFTPLLYHLPQSVLASVIMMAVIGLLNIRGFIHAAKAQPTDGIVSVLSFLCTIVFAPHLDRGILVGVGLSLAIFLHRGMRPRIVFLSRYIDHTFRDAERWNLKRCKHILVVRFNGTLFFANTSHLENRILSEIANMPEIKHVVLVGNGMNEIDASGEEILSQLWDRLHEMGLGMSFTGLSDGIVDVLRRTHLLEKIGEENLFPNVNMALNTIVYLLHEDSDEHPCPLVTPCPRSAPEPSPDAGTRHRNTPT